MHRYAEPRIWILGAPDPEMEAIERLLAEAGERIAHAVGAGGERVRPGDAYRATAHRYAVDCGAAGDAEIWYLVECVVPTPAGCVVTRIDHHRPGDPGYGRPPDEFMLGSSIGQVIAELARCGALPAWERNPNLHWQLATGAIARRHVDRDPQVICGPWEVGGRDCVPRVIPDEYVLTAAADHCLGAAYRGQCPEVEPDALMRWRAETRAAFQGRPVAELLADVEAARVALREAPSIDLADPALGPHTEDHDPSLSVCAGCARDPVYVRDMRRDAPIPELPEAAAREGLAYVSGPLIGPDGRRKYTCSGPPEVIRAFIGHWSEHLDGVYGDPARGFAGGYDD